jgi:hypothetical protein
MVILQAWAIIFVLILIFVLVSGLVVLWYRGADDLEAWGLFVSRVLRGDRQSTRKPPRDHRNGEGCPGEPADADHERGQGGEAAGRPGHGA